MTKRAWEASSSSQRWIPEVLPEHTIFLSHSGQDKPFVEHLCKELKRLNYSPFFDQNSDSIPKGERFPPHIFKAAEQCLLAVIVLSEGYLTSKWPMLELATFVKAKETRNPTMKLLPLFYKLSPSDLIVEKWLDFWKKLAIDGKIHAKEIELWSKGVEVLMTPKNVETERMKSLIEHDDEDEIVCDDFMKLVPKVVHDLCPFNGLEFNKYGTSEGRYIQVVVDEICKMIPPIMKYNIDGIRGYQRMCEKTSSLFEEGSLINDVCKSRCFYLGLYGMGGVGKTTLCGAMCSFHQVEFRGRVCHVELGSDTTYEKIERLKDVIRQLGGLDDKVVEKITTKEQGLQCLQDRLKSLPPAFLAVDNVGDSESSRDEARSFIKSILACGSKVMVTSRSRIILESILQEAKYCKSIPRLEEQEAIELFLSVAIPQKLLSPLQSGEDEIVKACVQDCQFVDDGYDSYEYHPLVLKALGAFFHDVNRLDIMKWKKALKSEKKLQLSRESSSVNAILGLNYARLSDELKLLFIDVAVFFNLRTYYVQHLTFRRCFIKDEYKWAIPLLATMHGISTSDVKMKVKELKRKSLIYESHRSLRVHDLYLDFVLSILDRKKEGTKENEWWVGHWDANGFNPTVKRIFWLKDASIFCPKELWGCPRKEEWGCPNLECLITINSKVTLKPKLDLESFPNLRLLIIFKKLDQAKPTYYNSEIFCGRKDENGGWLPKLLRVHLFGFQLRHLSFLKCCWNLTFLSIEDCLFDVLDFTLDGILLFENLEALETLILSTPPFNRVPSGVFDGILYSAKNLTNLKYLEIDLNENAVDGVCPCKLDLSPLGSLTSFQTLSLPNLPSCIEELIGLDQLSQLIELNLYHSTGLRKVPNLCLLPNLQRICIESCTDLISLEDQFKCFQNFHAGGECLDPNNKRMSLEKFARWHAKEDFSRAVFLDVVFWDI